ncbi:hypothetical protein GCM10022381_18980 [Leifsonia kafniensis]|uniref:Coenzyme F420:L-glutamate ligase-like domain-containing protein n=1 Tax=Leifsonia kafniensis TaxID=475957 RepID=A0ABP7KGB9_9MICO
MATDAMRDASADVTAGSAEIRVFVLDGIGEITAGDDLAEIILAAAERGAADGGPALADGDILAVTSKIVSKAEGRQRAAHDREQAITDETVRVVASRAHPGGVTRIVENRQGLVLAAAGVDASNTPDGIVLLLPVDPDASAHALCTTLRNRTGLRLGVLITDTAGRAWREGQTDIAIGAAGVAVLDDLRGTTDANGRRLDATVAAVADEIAAAADLVKGKTSGNPVAVVRGLGRLVGELESVTETDVAGMTAATGAAVSAGAGAGAGADTAAKLVHGARRLQRASEFDMFRLGSTEAHAEGFAEGFAAGRAAALAELTAASMTAPPAVPVVPLTEG